MKDSSGETPLSAETLPCQPHLSLSLARRSRGDQCISWKQLLRNASDTVLYP